MWPRMENVMSKTNDTSKPTTLEDHRPLADHELDTVSGGLVVISVVPILVGLLLEATEAIRARDAQH